MTPMREQLKISLLPLISVFFLAPSPSPRGALAPAFLHLPHRAQAHALHARLPAPLAAAAPAASTASPEAPASGAVPGKPMVLVAEKLGAGGLALLREFANVDCSYGLSPEELRAKISLCDALIVRSGGQRL
ncbi:D-3-phosphoglycerate dehydrogenase 2, chloroplastic-like [Panicum virgatum]|uniref:D-3-phosphoglycerate dehydrogenase 2, chloroplastic-like n=1 Tax=Panicum virgatum TaxID=38727 RepID=UPI0019D5AEFF|nr:D-3-phosphoglycerate dehydrogenase 2, chloroplastic-like [Panicum virgatum]